MDVNERGISFYVKHKSFADDFRNNPKRNWGDAIWNAKNNGYFLCVLNAK